MNLTSSFLVTHTAADLFRGKKIEAGNGMSAYKGERGRFLGMLVSVGG